MTGSTLRALERFLLPNVCVACRRPVERRTPDALVCGVCRSRLRRLGWGCSRCAHPLPPIGPCRFCQAWPSSLRWVRSAVWLDDEARDIIHELKYEGYTTLADVAAAFIARAVRRPAGTLIPVPLSDRRLKSRGYNQASAIAGALAKIWQLPVREDILRRTRNTASQTALTPDERLANVAGAFAATSPLSSEGRERRRGRRRAAEGPGSGETSAGEEGGEAITLIDDVLTTGATLAAAVTALDAAGWSDVGAVTFARARPFVIRALDV